MVERFFMRHWLYPIGSRTANPEELDQIFVFDRPRLGVAAAQPRPRARASGRGLARRR